MRFFKRLIVIVVLLLIAFFVYRLISPTGAKALLYDLKYFANERLGTHFSLDQEDDIGGSVIDLTGSIANDTGILQEFSEEDEFLLGDISLDEELFADEDSTPKDTSPTSSTTPSTTTTSPSSSSTTSSSKNGLSNQDLKDFKNLFGN